MQLFLKYAGARTRLDGDDVRVDELNLEFERLFAVSGWNQARVARELQLDPSVISRYRKGLAKPSLTVLSFFATKLGEQVLVPGVEAGIARSHSPPHLDAYEQDLIAQLRRFHSSQRREIVRGIATVLDAVAHPVIYGASGAKSGRGKPGEKPTKLSDATIVGVENDLLEELLARKKRQKGKT